MIHLPLYLDKQLKALFPRAQDRNDFVAGLVKDALEKEAAAPDDAPVSVGGALHLFTDGGSRGNPGQAAIGCVLIDPTNGDIVAEHLERIGVETNNIAEYRALIAGLQMAQRYQPNQLLCHLDSELVVKQLTGEYRVKMPTLQPLVTEIGTLIDTFTQVEFRHVPRADNHLADALVNRALDNLPAPANE